MEDLAKAFGMTYRTDQELQTFAASQKQRYKDRFLAELSDFDQADTSRFIYYRPGDAWICCDFIESFEGINHGIVRVLNGVLLCSLPEEEIAPWSVDEFHSEACLQHQGTWFVKLPNV